MLPELDSTWQITVFIFFIFEWVLRLVMLYFVPRKKSPATANGWLLLIMLLPTIGTLLYLMFGSPKLPRIRRQKQRKVDQLTAVELDELRAKNPQLVPQLDNPDYVSLSRLASVLGGLPPMTGNKVEIIDDYETIFSEIASSIDKAKKYVHIEYFIVAMDKSTEVIFKAIDRAAKRGVKVRVLYDKLASFRFPQYKAMLTRLDRAGVEHHEMIPLHIIPGKNFARPDLRNHRKIVVIDGKLGFTGSHNLVQKTYHRKDELQYEDLVIKLQGPAVWQLNNVFRSDWYPETGEALLDLVEDQDLPKSAGDVTAQVLPSGPSHEEENNLRFYTSMVHSAKQRVGIVVPYFIPDDSFLDAITTAAQRGVEVTIINSAIMDKAIVGHAQRSYYDELLEAGVNIYLYDSPVFLHNKQLIIDEDLAVVGSSNLDIRSFALDLELNTILYDKKVVAQLYEIESNYLEKAQKLTLKNWSQRPFRHKILESLARISAPLQ
jgi:cardiolipin synthase